MKEFAMQTVKLALYTAYATLAVLLLISALRTPPVLAQTPPVIAYSDAIKFDALKVDADKVGFKVQVQMDAQLTTWSDVPAASLGLPIVLPDTLPNSVTYQVPISPATPAGIHTLRLRYCAVPENGTVATCGAHTSVQFDLRASPPPPVGPPPAAPANIRFGPKSGGITTEDAVDTFGWLNDVPGVAGMIGGRP
jgi:hypothetical protein